MTNGSGFRSGFSQERIPEPLSQSDVLKLESAPKNPLPNPLPSAVGCDRSAYPIRFGSGFGSGFSPKFLTFDSNSTSRFDESDVLKTAENVLSDICRKSLIKVSILQKFVF